MFEGKSYLLYNGHPLDQAELYWPTHSGSRSITHSIPTRSHRTWNYEIESILSFLSNFSIFRWEVLLSYSNIVLVGTEENERNVRSLKITGDNFRILWNTLLIKILNLCGKITERSEPMGTTSFYTLRYMAKEGVDHLIRPKCTSSK